MLVDVVWTDGVLVYDKVRREGGILSSTTNTCVFFLSSAVSPIVAIGGVGLFSSLREWDRDRFTCFADTSVGLSAGEETP